MHFGCVFPVVKILRRDSLFVFRVRHVYGYEVVAEAISDARRNAKFNGIHNATFVQGDLNKISGSFGNDFPKPDIVISGFALSEAASHLFSGWIFFRVLSS